MAKPIPDGFPTVTPHIVVDGAARAIEFYRAAFGAEEESRMMGPDGQRLLHAQLRIGDTPVMLVDEFPEWGPKRSPSALGGSSVTLNLYVEDCDAAMDRAAKAGATVTMPAMDTFWGDRYGKLRDPFGHDWGVATHQRDMTQQEIQEAAAAFFSDPNALPKADGG